MRWPPSLSPALLLIAGCTATKAPPTLMPTPVSQAAPAAGIERVMGHDAAALAGLLGAAALDVREGPARKLQYRGPACVLDAYLYPPAAGAEPKVNWIDARDRLGANIDRASCIAALAARQTAAPVRRR